jgi:hypothetical protein
VFGWFPFDDQGQIESLDRAAGDGFGPCEALCRGACGADCDEDDCTLSDGLSCELDESGSNTGRVVETFLQDCGTAEGCREHDDCYDTCHDTHGCGTWSAAWCRRGCDQIACSTYGLSTCIDWARGFGPKDPDTLFFEYLVKPLVPVPDTSECPIGGGTVEYADPGFAGTRLMRSPNSGFTGPSVYSVTSTSGVAVSEGQLEVTTQLWEDIVLTVLQVDPNQDNTEIVFVDGVLDRRFLSPESYLWEAPDGRTIALPAFECTVELLQEGPDFTWLSLGPVSPNVDGDFEYSITFDPLTDVLVETGSTRSWRLDATCTGDEIHTDAMGATQVVPISVSGLGLDITLQRNFTN